MAVKSDFDDNTDDDDDVGGNDDDDDDGDDGNCGGDYDDDDIMLRLLLLLLMMMTIMMAMVMLIIQIMIQVIQIWKRIVYSDNSPTYTLTHGNLPQSQQQPVIISPQGTSSLLRQGNTAVSNAIPANK